MQERWTRLLYGCCNASVDACRSAFDDLAARYAEPHRHYHTLDHLRAVLEAVDRIGASAPNPAALELAVWFHDVIYDPRAGDNEERSAAHARVVLGPLGAPTAVLEEAARLILLTRTHRTEATDADGRILLDADLAVLGADDEDYDRYAAAIRREYAWVDEAAYRTGRRRVLEEFLNRPRIYWTDAAFGRLEQKARHNLRREIATLAV